MAHFALIDENNIVINVIVVADEHEHRGQQFLADDLGLGGTWIQTSYNARIRKMYAGIGCLYDPIDDTFKPPKPENATEFDYENWDWVVPITE